MDIGIIDQKLNLMADIHVQTRRHSRYNPTWMWTWIIIGIIIIAAVVYYVYANKDEDASNQQDLKNQRNTPMPGAAVPQQPSHVTYVMHIA
jgi:hypothetical protein